MTYALGIDLGTTYTAAAIARSGRAEVAALGYRATSVPTVVFLRDEGDFLVGDAAERRAAQEPSRVAREFKRRVGDPTPLLLGGTPVAVDRCLAEVLRWVIATVSEGEGGPPAALTVTHPANWGEFKQDVLREALRLVDAPDAGLLSEPVAAATWYGQAERLAPGRAVAVYDLGGGTFDAAVLRRRPDGGFESLGRAEGIERLGGIDVDEAVLGHVLRAVGVDRSSLEDDDDPAVAIAAGQLRRACVEAKEALSAETSVSIPVWLRNVHHTVLLQRSELEQLVRPLLAPTVDALARVVTTAGLRPDDLDAVLLVGGSSRIPLVARLVSEGLGRPIAVDAHPKHPVALGAALDAVRRTVAVSPVAPPGPQDAPTGPNPQDAPARPAGVRPVVPTGVPLRDAGAPWGPTHPNGPVPPAAPSYVPPASGFPAGPPQSASAHGARPGPHDAPAAARHGAATPPFAAPGSTPPAGSTPRRSVALVAVAVVAVIGLVALFALRADSGDDDDASTGRLTTSDEPSGASDATTTTAPTTPTTAPPVVNLLADPAPALAAFGAIHETTPRVRELTLYDGYAFAEVQVPGEPTHVDEYRFEDGSVDGPEPVTLLDMEIEELESVLFDVTEIDPAIVAGLGAPTLERCAGEGFELTHVIIDRTFDDDAALIIRVYADHPVRGGGGYVAYAVDGTEVANYC